MKLTIKPSSHGWNLYTETVNGRQKVKGYYRSLDEAVRAMLREAQKDMVIELRREE
jgi:hypothetical protein